MGRNSSLVTDILKAIASLSDQDRSDLAWLLGSVPDFEKHRPRVNREFLGLFRFVDELETALASQETSEISRFTDFAFELIHKYRLEKRNRCNKPNVDNIQKVEEYKKNHTWDETDEEFGYSPGGARKLIQRAEKRKKDGNVATIDDLTRARSHAKGRKKNEK